MGIHIHIKIAFTADTPEEFTTLQERLTTVGGNYREVKTEDVNLNRLIFEVEGRAPLNGRSVTPADEPAKRSL